MKSVIRKVTNEIHAQRSYQVWLRVCWQLLNQVGDQVEYKFQVRHLIKDQVREDIQ